LFSYGLSLIEGSVELPNVGIVTEKYVVHSALLSIKIAQLNINHRYGMKWKDENSPFGCVHLTFTSYLKCFLNVGIQVKIK
jgi:hypothetical protein